MAGATFAYIGSRWNVMTSWSISSYGLIVLRICSRFPKTANTVLEAMKSPAESMGRRPRWYNAHVTNERRIRGQKEPDTPDTAKIVLGHLAQQSGDSSEFVRYSN